jgi:NAD+ kinase
MAGKEANMASKQPFKRVALMARKHRAPLAETLTATVEALQHAGFHPVIESTTAKTFGAQSCESIPAEKLNQHADIVCVIGGDGSLLHAAKTALEQDLPIIGVNRGRLGFLADIHPQNLDQLLDVLHGNYLQENRFLLNVRIVNNEETTYQAVALNDVVLQQGKYVHMIEFDTSVDNKIICNQRADGLVIATPTGSTAYALSGGGPILHPSLDVVVMVPMFPHKLTSRPIVIHGHSTIDIHISVHNESPPRISCDGQASQTTPLGSHIIIQEEKRKLKLIHPTNYSYYETLRQKLGWESKPNALQ